MSRWTTTRRAFLAMKECVKFLIWTSLLCTVLVWAKTDDQFYEWLVLMIWMLLGIAIGLVVGTLLIFWFKRRKPS